MKIFKTEIDGLLIIEPQVFRDERGYFYESYNVEKYAQTGIGPVFVQDNQSFSQKGTIRGLHYQRTPFEQGKLVRVIKGAVYDVAVDIRKNSPTYGKFHGVELTEENMLMYWIPPGFAHGFEVLRDDTIFQYKCTKLYNKESEGGVFWNDPELGIPWSAAQPIVSDRDKNLPKFAEFNSPF